MAVKSLKKLTEEEINEELSDLKNQNTKISNRISRLCKEKTRRIDVVDQTYIDKLPKNIKKYTVDHWKKLLHVPGPQGQGSLMYAKLSNALQAYKLNNSGFNIETKQSCVYMSAYHSDVAKFKEWFISTYKALNGRDLKPGYRTPSWKNVWGLTIYGLVEDLNCVAYIRLAKPHKVLLYDSRSSNAKEFKNIDKFIDYLKL